MFSKQTLEHWLEYIDEVEAENKRRRRFNMSVEKEAEAYSRMDSERIGRYNKEWEKYQQKPMFVQLFTTPPEQPIVNEHKYHDLDHKMKPLLRPDFGGFMNFLLEKKGLVE